MLPSGNDSAHQLAEFFGGKLKAEADELEEKEEKQRQQCDEGIGVVLESIQSNIDTNHSDAGPKVEPASPRKNEIRRSNYVDKRTQFKQFQEVMYFLEEMNKTAERIGLKNSWYDSPHGLSNFNNKTSAFDIAKLSALCMKMSKFREVVNTKFYMVKKNTNGNKRTYKWHNTHLMLGQRGINGIKTGVTPNAGPCLCTSIVRDEFEICVVIICTKDMDIRWPETWKLANWAMSRMKLISKFQRL